MVVPEEFISLAWDGTNTRPYIQAVPAKPISEHTRNDCVIVAYEDPRLVVRPALRSMDGRIGFMKHLDLRNAMLAQESPAPSYEAGMR